MANTYCQDGYCEPAGKESNNMVISDKVIIGGYILFLIILTAAVLHGVSMGIYIDPTFLN